MKPDDFLAWVVGPAKEVCSQYDLPYQVCVAQGAIESQWGEYGIGNGGFNLFGRKWGGEGDYVELETQEYYDGAWQTIIAKFQSYASLEDAIKDWCELMLWVKENGELGPYTAVARQYQQNHDVEAFVRGIGPIYATDPEYADKILQTIRACELS